MMIFVFIFGLAIGSFLNVLIDRLPREESINGRSHCDHCKHKLTWYDLIPVVSFLMLKRKCRYCGKKLSWQYPLVEIVTGIMFLLIFNFSFDFAQDKQVLNLYYLISYLGIISCLIVIFFSDAKYHIIDDRVQIALFIFSIILLPSQGSMFYVFFNRSIAAIAVAAPIYFLHWVTKGRGMGFGDVKLSFTIGFLLGIKNGFLALYIAFIIGAIIGMLFIFLRKRGLKSKIAFGPFLVIGIFLMLFFQEAILSFAQRIYGF